MRRAGGEDPLFLRLPWRNNAKGFGRTEMEGHDYQQMGKTIYTGQTCFKGRVNLNYSFCGRSLTKSLRDGFKRPVRSTEQPDGCIEKGGLHNFGQSCLYSLSILYCQ